MVKHHIQIQGARHMAQLNTTGTIKKLSGGRERGGPKVRNYSRTGGRNSAKVPGGWRAGSGGLDAQLQLQAHTEAARFFWPGKERTLAILEFKLRRGRRRRGYSISDELLRGFNVLGLAEGIISLILHGPGKWRALARKRKKR